MADDDKKEKGEASCELATEPKKPPLKVPPLGRKTGEGADNLQQRSKWFRRRTGG